MPWSHHKGKEGKKGRKQARKEGKERKQKKIKKKRKGKETPQVITLSSQDYQSYINVNPRKQNLKEQLHT